MKPNLAAAFFAPVFAIAFSLASWAPGAAAEEPPEKIVKRVRAEAAKVLGKSPEEIDPARPLARQGADELDIVELVMALEEAFEIEIPEDAVELNLDRPDATLTVKRLATIVSGLAKPK